MAKFLFLVSFIIVVFGDTSFAQEFKVAGKVVDHSATGLPQIIVTLLHAADSSSAGFEMTDDKGDYCFKKVKGGSCVLAIHPIGYAPFTLSFTVTEDITSLNIVLSESTTQLSEVVVSDKKPLIETALGKTIMNVSESALSAGSNVLELLRKAPGVQVQGSDITLKSANVLVLIDDKQTYLLGAELADYLRSLPAEQVVKIELITQPSSRYDAEGTGGIINIKTQKIHKQGFNGNVSLAIAQNVYPNTHNTGNLSYQKDKLTVYANTGYLHATGGLERRVDQVVRDPPTGDVISQSDMHSILRETFEDYNLKLGADYLLSKKATIGGSVKGIYHPNNEQDETYTDIIDQAGIFTRNITLADLGLIRDHYICNAYFKYLPAKDQSITVDADYLFRKQHNYLDLSSNNYDALSQPVNAGLYLRNNANSTIQVSVLKFDYEATLAGDLKIEAGAKASFSSTENRVYFEVLDNGFWRNDTSRTNKFIYKENINAAYVSANKTFGKKWKMQLGLRMENTNATGRQEVYDQEFHRVNTPLFPTAYVSYTANEKGSFELNCGRRINRPAYTLLNPFIFFRSQYSYFQGNPNLAPSFEWFTNLTHNFNNKIFTNASYGYTNGIITPAIRYNGSTNSVITSVENYSSAHSAHLSINTSKQFFKWWRCSSTVGVNYNAYDDIDRRKAVTSATGFYFSVENELNFNKGWAIDTSYHFANGDLQNLLDHYGPRQWIGFNVSKKFWKDNATLRLSVDDPFNIHRISSTLDYNGVSGSTTNKWNNQQVALGFSCKLGKRSETASQRQTNSEEAGRM